MRTMRGGDFREPYTVEWNNKEGKTRDHIVNILYCMLRSGSHLNLCIFICIFLKIVLIYLCREREKESRGVGGGAEREGEREFQADSELSAEPNVGLDFTTLRS